MKKTVFILTFITLSFTACSDIPPPPSVQAVIQAIENGDFVGIDKNIKADLEITWKHQGPYAQVKQLNYTIENGVYKGMKANVIIVQYEDTNQWEAVRLMINNNGQWQAIPRNTKVMQ
jgi:sporulation-control protein spo0M